MTEIDLQADFIVALHDVVDNLFEVLLLGLELTLDDFLNLFEVCDFEEIGLSVEHEHVAELFKGLLLEENLAGGEENTLFSMRSIYTASAAKGSMAPWPNSS